MIFFSNDKKEYDPLKYRKLTPLLLRTTPSQLGGVAWKSIVLERRRDGAVYIKILTLQHVAFIIVIFVSYIHNASVQAPKINSLSLSSAQKFDIHSTSHADKLGHTINSPQL